jgi:8-oxo-dGTP pyrophosphatase MutT (NUDIX family)
VSAVPDGLPPWLRRLADAAPGLHAEDLFRLAPPPGIQARPSAVLIAFRDSAAGPAVLLIQRAADMRRHPGQVAFPGGALDADDAGYTAAALREAAEETELDPASVLPFAELPALFIAGSGFAVTPVLAWWHTPHPLAPGDPAEVARVAIVPIHDLTAPANRFRVRHPAGGLGPGFAVDGLFVWGFTAILLDRLLALAGWELPWDRTRTRDLPPALAPGRGSTRADRERS